MKKMSGFCESLVLSQFLFHQSRYCSLFAPFPSLSHPLLLIMQAKTHSPLFKRISSLIKKSWTSWYKTFDRNSQSLGRDRVGWSCSTALWSKKMLFVVTSILSSTSIPHFHFLPSHSHFLSRLLVMLLYQGNIGRDIRDNVCEENATKYEWQVIIYYTVEIYFRYGVTSPKFLFRNLIMSDPECWILNTSVADWKSTQMFLRWHQFGVFFSCPCIPTFCPAQPVRSQ